MPQPRVSSFPQIRRALRFYQVCSVITGVGLLLLCAEMVLKYTPQLAVELFFLDSQGLFAFREVVPSPTGELISTGDGINLSLGILIVHGWFYVVYLFACFRVWSLMRWPFWRFLLLAGGGVVPFLSFFMEYFVARDVKRYLAQREETAAEKRAAKAASGPSTPSAPTQEVPR
ncbi:hypothetical protein GCM10017576_07370 [Microbacterium barkeri]|uniref:DUF3817 domain-containing protein n=1 Tax=Microbacterium barkeri TaxID=33917 RepID=A0A9W6H1X6_9MICO|nr:DUF3817 domain-containing protein [Microbacterium barkeri]MDR6875229.1 hypothetical protein [Microbacterium barkeri]GLJ60608.1 hypothetical protein GCM10017576_07370 [Microbacterium barkeri]